MASPSIAATNSSATSTAGTTHTVNLPTGIVSGDLLVIFFASAGNATTSVTATGWSTQGPSSGTGRSASLYRVADGTEGSTVSVTTSNSVKAAHASYRITGAATPNQSDTTWRISGFLSPAGNPDPGSVTPAGGSADYLFIAQCAIDQTATVSSYPTNYSLGQLNVSSGGSGAASTKVGLGVAARALTAASEDPGAFTLSASELGSWYTIAIYPAAPAVVYPRPLPRYGQALNRAANR